MRLTAQEAKPDARGTSENIERWVEFVQGGTVKGREVVSIVPQAEVKMVVRMRRRRPAASKVQTLKGSDYVRVWINKGGNHYLIHLPGAARRRDCNRSSGRFEPDAGAASRIVQPQC